ncbi:MAG: hypothetical protein AB7M05_05145 [Alphaproteobacteria bacterium]
MKKKLSVFSITAASYGAVFTSFRRFFLQTWAWMLLAWLTTFVLNLSVDLIFPPKLIKLSGMVAAYLLPIPIFAGAAVLWHRTIQLGEDRRGWRAVRLRGREWLYLAAEIGLVLTPLVPLLLSHFLGHSSLEMWIYFVSLPALTVASLYIVLRLALCLPLIAIGDRAPFSQSWRMMKGNLLRLVAIGLLVLVPMGLLTALASSVSEFALAYALHDPAYYPIAFISFGPAALGGIMMAGFFASILSFSVLHQRGLSVEQPVGAAPTPSNLHSSGFAIDPAVTGQALPALGPHRKLPSAQIASAVYAQVFHPFSRFLSKTWAWILVLAIASPIAASWELSLPASIRELQPKSIILMPISAAISVMWFRWVLLGETRKGLRAVTFPLAVWKLVGLFVLMMIGVFLPLYILAEMSKALVPENDYSQIRPSAFIVFIVIPIALAISGAFCYIALRLLLIQPLIAINETNSFHSAWNLSKGNIWRMIFTFLLVEAPVGALLWIFFALKDMFLEHGLRALAIIMEIIIAPFSVLGTVLGASAYALILLQRRGQPLPQRLT